MMAQRFPEALVTAIDIDEMAVSQAAENVAASPFADRIRVVAADVQTFRTAEKFDSIVCNPPFLRIRSPVPTRSAGRPATPSPSATVS